MTHGELDPGNLTLTLSQSHAEQLRCAFVDLYGRAGALEALVRLEGDPKGLLIPVFVDPGAWRAAVIAGTAPRPPLPELQLTEDDVRRLLDAERKAQAREMP